MLLEWWRRGGLRGNVSGGLRGNVSGGLRGRMRGHIRGRLRGSAAAAALWAHGALAADVSLAIAPTNWVTCLPVATATFSAELDSVVLEWAPGDAGAFTQIATCPDPSAESWTVELPGTVVGQPRRYRLTMTSDGSALYIDGSEGFNAFSGASLKKTTRTLAAGDHDIELIYRSVNTKKSFTFTWALEGVWSERPVPTASGSRGLRCRRASMTAGVSPRTSSG